MKLDTQQPTQQNTEHKEGFFERHFDHHHHNNGHDDQDPKGRQEDSEGGIRSSLKKDEARFKEYIKEDEQLEEEGQTYGGLM